MHLPTQAAPVTRGRFRSYQLQSHQMNRIDQQGCNWLECAAVAIPCAAACIDTLGAACVACLGSSYAACKDCF